MSKQVRVCVFHQIVVDAYEKVSAYEVEGEPFLSTDWHQPYPVSNSVQSQSQVEATAEVVAVDPVVEGTHQQSKVSVKASVEVPDQESQSAVGVE